MQWLGNMKLWLEGYHLDIHCLLELVFGGATLSPILTAFVQSPKLTCIYILYTAKS